MPDPLAVDATSVPAVGRRSLVIVDGRSFAISDDAGQMYGPTHGLVYDDRRHLSRLDVGFDTARLDVLASSTPTPLSAVIVARLVASDRATSHAVVTRRRWVADGLREDVQIHNTTATTQCWTMRITLAADFAHVFDVKAGLTGTASTLDLEPGGWVIRAGDDPSLATRVRVAPLPDKIDLPAGELRWTFCVAARSNAIVRLTVEPIVDERPAGLDFPIDVQPAAAIPMRRLEAWRASVPRVVSTDPRLSTTVDQALADLAALRIVDSGHADRVVIAAGAPWFMTLFGRDSLLTSLMTLPFEPTLARGVLYTLADLQGRTYDAVAEEQPGKILHELRRHGGGGPFATRQRYFGSVDATPLFVMLAAETMRWGALQDQDLELLGPAVDAAIAWLLGDGDSDGDGFIDYRRRHESGLSNQGWKDSWDGITFADGSLPQGPIALAEVQGYTYAALTGAVGLVEAMSLRRDADSLLDRAERLKTQFNDRFWEPRGWFALGLDRAGTRIDALTTNPGHACWTGIAEPELAARHLEHFANPEMWTGWGLRTLSETMTAYDPLSYHNGSVWPHDTAICAAGAARYGQWDLVDQIVNGALDAASEFDGRPPELFAGISHDEAPMPVSYPASCSPQAWSSASVLLLVCTMLGLVPNNDRSSVRLDRPDLSTLPDLTIDPISVGGRSVTVRIAGGTGLVTDRPSGRDSAAG